MTAADAGGGATDDSESQVALSILGDYLFADSSLLAHASTGPYPSALTGHDDIDVWLTAPAAGAYETIDPDRSGSDAHLPVGTMIIRQVLDSTGQVSKLTVMFKAPPGYYPVDGDWWFGETDGDGVPIEQDGRPVTGRLEACASCHVARASDDYLFGVVATARAGG